MGLKVPANIYVGICQIMAIEFIYTAISKMLKRNPNHPEYDSDFVPPTGKFSVCLHTVKNPQKTSNILT